MAKIFWGSIPPDPPRWRAIRSQNIPPPLCIFSERNPALTIAKKCRHCCRDTSWTDGCRSYVTVLFSRFARKGHANEYETV